jgi:dTDP-4-dehydrorhamnose 3,5-epimerase
MKKLNFKLTKFKSFSDKRGKLIVFLKESELHSAKKKFGQIYFVTFNKRGAVRGNHYHKKWYEWFGIVEGKVKVIIEDVRTKKRKQITLSAEKDKYIRIETGPYIAHAIVSLTKRASLLSYADTEWTTDDTHYYKLA